jgi:hypothetical protein
VYRPPRRREAHQPNRRHPAALTCGHDIGGAPLDGGYDRDNSVLDLETAVAKVAQGAPPAPRRNSRLRDTATESGESRSPIAADGEVVFTFGNNREQRDGDSFIINGRKYWPSPPGWDAQGVNAQCVIVRTNSEMGGTEELSAIMGSVARPRCRASSSKGGPPPDGECRSGLRQRPRARGEPPPRCAGQWRPGNQPNFAWSGPIAATAAVGVARAAYELALDFAKGTPPARSSPSSTSRMSAMSS